MRLSVKEVAALFGVTGRVVLRWVEQDDLPFSRVDGHYRFRPADLLEWATARGMKVPPRLFADPEEEEREPVATIAEALTSGGIVQGKLGADKRAVIEELVRRLPLPKSADREALLHVVLAREHMASTGIGGGIAIPHVRNPIVLRVTKPMICLGLLDEPIEYGAIDGKPVHAVLLTITPTTRSHLHVLSRLGYVLQDRGVRDALAKRASASAILAAVAKAESGLVEPRAGS